jgi:hypothetical protein
MEAIGVGIFVFNVSCYVLSCLHRIGANLKFGKQWLKGVESFNL